jgi:hypothetical protein
MWSETGKGTYSWTDVQKSELLNTGKVKGFVGHHINSVNPYSELAGNPDNIIFVDGTKQHLVLHKGNWKNPTSGELSTR